MVKPNVGNIMMPHRSIKRLPLVAFVLIVCVAGVVAGGAWGAVAGARLIRRGGIGGALAGAIFGATAGFLAAALWCKILLPLIVRAKRPHRDIISYGMKWGAVVGGMAGIIVFFWLLLNVLSRSPYLLHHTPMLIGRALACTAFAGCIGIVVGLVCGWVGWLAAKFALPLPPLKPALYPQHHIVNLTTDHPASHTRRRQSMPARSDALRTRVGPFKRPAAKDLSSR